MIVPFFNVNLFNSKVDLAPVEEQKGVTPLGIVEKHRVTLGMEKKLFSCTADFIPIIAAMSGTTYLQANSNGSDTVVLSDNAGKQVAIMERVDGEFNIYSFEGPEPVPLAKVTQVGKVLHVILEGESEPTFTIHEVVPHPSRKFPTKHIIKTLGKPTASTRYGKGNSYMLAVNAGADCCLMTCLAAIADEISE